MELFIIFLVLLVLSIAVDSYYRRKNPTIPVDKPTEPITDTISTSPKFQPQPTVDLVNPIRHCNQFMSAQDKQAYLQSSIWATKRELVFSRDNYQCKSCGSIVNLECHHIDYTYLGDEPLEHLVTLCRNCHQSVHNLLGYDRKTLYPIPQ